MRHVYLVRYGSMRHVGRFEADRAGLQRGQAVVVSSRRGTEIAEVLTAEAWAPPVGPPSTRILRVATPDDLDRARAAGLERDRRLAICEEVFRDGLWPIELLDVEPLLDEARTVLYYLGPHRLDAQGLLEVLRESRGIDAWLEPVGRDEPAEVPEPAGCGSCGSEGGGGCGSGGGCGTSAGGCSGCSVKDLVAKRHAVAAG